MNTHFPKKERGYALHERRLARRKDAKQIRTIKFPVCFKEGSEKDHLYLADAICKDYFTLYGQINFDNFVDYKSNKELSSGYSIMELELDLLAEGILFFYTPEELKQFKTLLFNGEDPYKILIGNLSNDFQEGLKVEDFQQFFSKDARVTSDKLENKFLSLYEKKFQTKENLIICAQKFAKYLKENPNKKEEEQISQIDFKFSLFNFSKETIAKFNEAYQKSSFQGRICILKLPNFNKVIKSSNREILFTEYFDNIYKSFINYFDNLEDQKKEDREQLKKSFFNMFSDDKGGRINYILNILASINEDNNLEEFERIFKESHRFLKEGELESTLNKVIKLFQAVQKIYLIKNIAKYRSDFQGKISSWFSNYQRHIENFSSKNIEPIIEELDKLKSEVLKNQEDQEEDKDKVAELIAEIDYVESGLNSFEQRLTPELVNLTERKISNVNSLANSLLQKATSSRAVKDEDEEKFSYSNKYKNLSKGLNKYPSFFGDEAKKRWIRFYHAPYRLRKLNEILAKIEMEVVKNLNFDSIILKEEEVERIRRWFVTSKTRFTNKKDKSYTSDFLKKLGLENTFDLTSVR